MRALALQLRRYVVRSVPSGLSGRVVGPKGAVLFRIPMLGPAGLVTVMLSVMDWVGCGARDS